MYNNVWIVCGDREKYCNKWNPSKKKESGCPKNEASSPQPAMPFHSIPFHSMLRAVLSIISLTIAQHNGRQLRKSRYLQNVIIVQNRNIYRISASSLVKLSTERIFLWRYNYREYIITIGDQLIATAMYIHVHTYVWHCSLSCWKFQYIPNTSVSSYVRTYLLHLSKLQALIISPIYKIYCKQLAITRLQCFRANVWCCTNIRGDKSISILLKRTWSKRACQRSRCNN